MPTALEGAMNQRLPFLPSPTWATRKPTPESRAGMEEIHLWWFANVATLKEQMAAGALKHGMREACALLGLYPEFPPVDGREHPAVMQAVAMALVCMKHESNLQPVCFNRSSATNPSPLPNPLPIQNCDDGLGLGQVTVTAFAATDKVLPMWWGWQDQVLPFFGAATTVMHCTYLIEKLGSLRKAYFAYAGPIRGNKTADQYATDPKGLVAWHRRFFPNIAV
jgi:hypothetical protein